MKFLMCLLLSGCGSLAAIQNAEDTEFIFIIEGEASGVYELIISGGLNHCKVLKNGDLDGISVVYTGTKCTVSIGDDIETDTLL